jgi:hypothetical protein
MHNPKDSHMQTVYRLLKYLKSTPSKRILYKKHENFKLEYYTNDDYVGVLTYRKSTSSYCTLLEGNLVMRRSKKHNVMSRSSVKAESKTMALRIYELLWMKINLEDLRIKWDELMRLYCDNKSVIGIAHNLVQHDKTKHVNILSKKN